MSNLRLNNCAIEGYIDDFFTKADTFEKCSKNVYDITECFDKLGFVVHPEKSQFEPTQ